MTNDYIRREEAVDALDELRVNSLDAENGLLLLSGIAAASDTIESLEPADVVPVVRCKECKYWDNGNLSFECPWDYGRHGSSDEDDFCSYGERKE